VLCNSIVAGVLDISESRLNNVSNIHDLWVLH
jgi:hypothetical protein